MAEFSDRVVLVTGSSSGIGEQIARRFADLGAAVVVNSSSSIEAGERVATELGNRACYVHEAIPGRCLKVVRSDLAEDSGKGSKRAGGDDNQEELRILRSLHRRLDAAGRSMFPACDGVVETDLGPALVTQLFTDHDGRISLTLDHVLAAGRYTIRAETRERRKEQTVDLAAGESRVLTVALE